jgi:tetratricopeptide (TPR) repeat protein
LLTLDSGNIAARLALATLLENEKRPEAALPLLAKAAGPEVDARLAILQVKSGQIEEGLATLDRVSSPQHVTPALTVATLITERGDRRLARSVVQSSIARTVDPGMSFPLLCKAVELLTPEDGAPTAQRELRRLRQAALGKETLLASYLEFAQNQSERLGVTAEFSAELKTLWSAGTGPIAAGTVLLAAELKRNAADAEKTLEQLLARRDGGEVWPYRIATVLEGANRPEWLVRVREHLARSNPALGQAAIDWARSLDQLGRKAEARAALEQLQARTPAGDELAGKIAQAFAQLGDSARARKLFAEAVRHDPFVRLFHTHLDFARLQLAERDFSGAKRSLRAAFSNPANREFPVILDWLAASGQLEQADAALLDLGLTGGRHATVRRALAQRLIAERKLTAVLALLEAQPSALSADLLPQLHELARSEQGFQPLAALLEKLVAQDATNQELTLALTKVLGESAANELAAGRTEPALTLLRRAHELRPEQFAAVRDLATLQIQLKTPKRAIEVLERFLATPAPPAELEAARELLARARGSGKL